MVLDHVDSKSEQSENNYFEKKYKVMQGYPPPVKIWAPWSSRHTSWPPLFMWCLDSTCSISLSFYEWYSILYKWIHYHWMWTSYRFWWLRATQLHLVNLLLEHFSERVGQNCTRLLRYTVAGMLLYIDSPGIYIKKK